jgi:predicted porin
LSGQFDGGFASQKTFGQTTGGVIQNASKTTAFKFNGTEDLGGGLSANFQFEVQPSFIAGNGNTNNAAAFGSTTTPAYANGAAVAGTVPQTAQSGLVGKGQSYVGLKSNTLGTVNFGTINLASLSAWANATGAFGTNIGSGYKAVGNETTRAENTVAYVSPAFSGFSASAARSTGQDAVYGTTSTINLRRSESTEYGLTYENGPVKAMYADLTSTSSPLEATASANIDSKYKTLSAKYDAGVVRVGALNQKYTANTTVEGKYTTNLFSVEVPMGAWTFTALTGKQKVDGVGAATSGTKTIGDNKVASLQAKYDLSKRTYVYVMNEVKTLNSSSDWAKVVVNGAALAAAPTDNKIKTTAIGLAHAF